jgi:hypothetical protein
MKTNITKKSRITCWDKINLKTIKAFFLSAFIVIASNCFAQPSKLNGGSGISSSTVQSKPFKFGLNLARSSSGDAFGAFYKSGLYVKHNCSKFELSVNIQQKKLKLSGLQLGYEYSVMQGSNDPGNRAELFVFCRFNYVRDAYLSNRVAKIEHWVNKEDPTDFNSLKFSTLESYTGFGCRVFMSQRMKFTSSIGVGGFTTIKGMKNLHRDPYSISLQFNGGLTFDLN